MEKKIFVSVGRNGTPAQEAFVGAIRDRLRGAGLLPCTVGQDYWTDKAPLKGVTELMTECTGAVIIALERSYFPEGIERRDHPTAKRQLRDIKLTTPFNQVETALAYAHGHPLLVIVEAGVREEGLLEDKHGWHIQRVEPTAAWLTTQEFNGVFERWKDRVETKSKN